MSTMATRQSETYTVTFQDHLTKVAGGYNPSGERCNVELFDGYRWVAGWLHVKYSVTTDGHYYLIAIYVANID